MFGGLLKPLIYVLLPPMLTKLCGIVAAFIPALEQIRFEAIQEPASSLSPGLWGSTV